MAVYKVQQVRRRKPSVGEMVERTATVADGLRANASVYIHAVEGDSPPRVRDAPAARCPVSAPTAPFVDPAPQGA